MKKKLDKPVEMSDTCWFSPKFKHSTVKALVESQPHVIRNYMSLYPFSQEVITRTNQVYELMK